MRKTVKLFLERYKFPLLISIVCAIAIITLRLETRILNIILIIIGSLVSSFILDLDYIFYVFLVNPKHYFSREVARLIGTRNYSGVFEYIEQHRKGLRELPLHSALFQSVLAVVCFYVLISSKNVLAKSLVIVLFVQIFYEQAKDYFEHKKLDNWFWVLKTSPSQRFLIAYFSIMLITFFYFLFLL